MNHPQPDPNPGDRCLCGCGQKTAIASYTNRPLAIVKGHPLRYLPGHSGRKHHNLPEGIKHCFRCKRDLPGEQFYPRKVYYGRSPYKSGECVACARRRHTVENGGEPLRLIHKASKLKRIHGMLIEDYEQLLSIQNGVCAICLKYERALHKGRIKSLAVDHDHATGKIRGLLCSSCNNGLGRFQDDPKLTQKATDYLLRQGC